MTYTNRIENGKIVQLTADEIAALQANDAAIAANIQITAKADVRARRNYLIAQCDFCMLPDAPATVVNANATVAQWQAYRQALRDITTQPDMTAIVWPVPPIAMPA